MFAEVGEVLAGNKTLPKVPDCGKKFIVFKSLGRQNKEKDGWNQLHGASSLNSLVSAPLPVG